MSNECDFCGNGKDVLICLGDYWACPSCLNEFKNDLDELEILHGEEE